MMGQSKKDGQPNSLSMEMNPEDLLPIDRKNRYLCNCWVEFEDALTSSLYFLCEKESKAIC